MLVLVKTTGSYMHHVDKVYAFSIGLWQCALAGRGSVITTPTSAMSDVLKAPFDEGARRCHHSEEDEKL